MDYDAFKFIIESLEKIRERSHILHQVGVDLMEYEDLYHSVLSTFKNASFKEEGVDWIDWYLYERIDFDNKENAATDENGNEICHNINSLWETVKPYRKQ